MRELAAAAISAVRQPLGRLLDEVMGPASGSAGEEPAPPATGETVEFGVVLHRHRRVAGITLCLLLIMGAAVGAAPAVSLAGDPVPDATAAPETPAPGDVAIADPQGDVQAVDGDAGDGSISNVMQPLDAVAATGSGFQVYSVKGGDTLAKVGARFGLTRQSVYWANSSKLPDAATLRVGQKLLIPPTNGMTVTVRSNDTMSGYASKYRTTVKAIMTVNGMTSPNLTVGKLLLIPGVVPPIPAPSCGQACAGWHGQKLKWPVPASHRINQYYSHAHWGLDIGAQYGSSVIAAVNGTVIAAGWKSGSGSGGGIVVWINSGGKLWTTYNHLSAVFVKKGQTVKAGQRIAAIGSTGLSTGPHLHFEVWTCMPWSRGSSDGAMNPLNYM